ncbi:MAG: triose-phosphate isomerase [Nitrospirota bacterium]|jgi:triosephosphate isomerase
MRKPIIAANWKMHKTVSETEEFLGAFLPEVQHVDNAEIVIAPPFTSLERASRRMANSNVALAAQNVFYEEKGAYTGEISPLMVKNVGCSYAIVGHSERRQYFLETDEAINKKVNICPSCGLKVIFCIGESLEEREGGRTNTVLDVQLRRGLEGADLGNVVVAYEPVWAIGTGVTATTEQAQEAHRFIRDTLRDIFGDKADRTRILYGGSVKPDNIDDLMACADVDGALVGGASLEAESFSRIVKFRRT